MTYEILKSQSTANIVKKHNEDNLLKPICRWVFFINWSINPELKASFHCLFTKAKTVLMF